MEAIMAAADELEARFGGNAAKEDEHNDEHEDGYEVEDEDEDDLSALDAPGNDTAAAALATGVSATTASAEGDSVADMDVDPGSQGASMSALSEVATSAMDGVESEDSFEAENGMDVVHEA